MPASAPKLGRASNAAVPVRSFSAIIMRIGCGVHTDIRCTGRHKKGLGVPKFGMKTLDETSDGNACRAIDTAKNNLTKFEQEMIK